MKDPEFILDIKCRCWLCKKPTGKTITEQFKDPYCEKCRPVSESKGE